MDLFLTHWPWPTTFCVCFYAFQRKSLDVSGLVAAFIVCILTCFAGVRYFSVLITFFLTSSAFTKFGSKKKKIIEDGYQENGNRNYLQVFANGGIPTLLVIFLLVIRKFSDSILLPHCLVKISTIQDIIFSMFLGSYACATADTWSSELGSLSTSSPRLITTFQKVPVGTNGGVSWGGLFASVLGGVVIGVSSYLTSLNPTSTCRDSFHILFASGFCGVFGSLVDSLLGATLQLSLYDHERKVILADPSFQNLFPPGGKSCYERISGRNVLNNHQVNFLAVTITALFSPFIFRFFV
eukprot:Sdes_comp18058_c0_seq2m7438